MKKKLAILIIWLALGPPVWAAVPTPTSDSGMAMTLTADRWSAVLSQFEATVFSMAKWLENARTDKQKIQSAIDNLEKKVAALRKETQGGANVFGEIQLKSRLNDLRAKLEENSKLQHQWDGKQKEFEQKALSLVELYNERIQGELESTDSTGLSGLDPKLNLLTSIIQKRNQVQYLLSKYRSENDSEILLPLSSIGPLKKHDRENLQMALDLFNDRKKDLNEQLEKWSLEEDQLKNELKLQGKMQEFIEDIRQINEDSDLPRGGLKQTELEGLVGKGQKDRLEGRIGDLQEKINRGGKTLNQISKLIEKVRHQLDSLDERKPE